MSKKPGISPSNIRNLILAVLIIVVCLIVYNKVSAGAIKIATGEVYIIREGKVTSMGGCTLEREMPAQIGKNVTNKDNACYFITDEVD